MQRFYAIEICKMIQKWWTNITLSKYFLQVLSNLHITLSTTDWILCRHSTTIVNNLNVFNHVISFIRHRKRSFAKLYFLYLFVICRMFWLLSFCWYNNFKSYNNDKYTNDSHLNISIANQFNQTKYVNQYLFLSLFHHSL